MLNKKSALLLISSMLLSASAYSKPHNGYITGLAGFAIPLKSKADMETLDEASNTMKTSTVIPGSFYQAFSIAAAYFVSPNVGIEFSVDYTPKYDLSLELSDNKGTAKTTLRSSTINLGIVYKIGEYGTFSPYVVGGAGWTTFRSHGSEEYVKSASGTNIFKFLPNEGSSTISYYLGLGVTKDITENIKLNFQIKGQIFQEIAMDYEKINTKTGVLNSHASKKLFGVGKFQAGIMFAF